MTDVDLDHLGSQADPLSRTDTRLRPNLLCAFMQARLAEDEVAALDGPRADRLMAEVKGKRRIVLRFSMLEDRVERFPGGVNLGEVAAVRMCVLDLAQPYADHPDFLDSWRS